MSFLLIILEGLNPIGLWIKEFAYPLGQTCFRVY